MPCPVERIFNRIFGFSVGLGLGFSCNHLLQVRGRTQWVRNAEAAGEVKRKKRKLARNTAGVF